MVLDTCYTSGISFASHRNCIKEKKFQEMANFGTLGHQSLLYSATMSSNSDAPSLGAATTIDEEAQMELVKEVKIAAWLKDQVAQEIVRSFSIS